MSTRRIVIAITLANMLTISSVVLFGDYVQSQKQAAQALFAAQEATKSAALTSKTKSNTTTSTSNFGTVTKTQNTQAQLIQQNTQQVAAPDTQQSAPVQNTTSVQADPPVVAAAPTDPPAAAPTDVPQAPAPTDTPAAAPPPSGCVISIDGVSYEITSLRSTHSGGDVFTCGADMSAIFWGQHGNSILRKMAKYQI